MNISEKTKQRKKTNRISAGNCIMLILSIAILIIAICILIDIRNKFFNEYQFSEYQFSANECETLEYDDVIENEGEEITTDEDLLILVNRDKGLPENYNVKLRLLDNNIHKVAEVLYDDLDAMLTDGSDAGLSFCIASAYRSSEYQQSLVDKYVSEAMAQGMSYKEAYKYVLREVMPPGHSEHETGLALDIVAVDYQMLDNGQELTAENEWLRDNCYKYGFILRYPEDKEDITGIAYEAWHFRYVGKSAAKYMYENNLTLEEYLAVINSEA